MLLLELPIELLFIIAKDLNLPDLNRLIKTCKSFLTILTPILHTHAFHPHHRMRPLHWASAVGHDSLVRILLASKRPEVFNPDPYWPDRTPLHWSSVRGRETITLLLIENGLDIEARDDRGFTPLLLAAKAGNVGVMEILIQAGADLQARNNDGEAILHIAANNGFETVLEMVLGLGININITTDAGSTALHCAIIRGKDRIVRQLISEGADLTIVDSFGNTPVYIAASYSYRKAMIRLLLESGPDISTADENGDTLLHHAARESDQTRAIQVIKQLLEMSAPVNVLNKNGDSPLSTAIRSKSERVVMFLILKHGVDLTSPITFNKLLVHCTKLGSTLTSTNYSDITIVRTLVYALTKLPPKCWLDAYGSEVLARAAEVGENDVCAIILAAGIPVDTVDASYKLDTSNRHRTPLSFASTPETASCLISHGANIEARDLGGYTPLHRACYSVAVFQSRRLSSRLDDFLDVVKTLVNSGADANAISNSGETPYVFATRLSPDANRRLFEALGKPMVEVNDV